MQTLTPPSGMALTKAGQLPDAEQERVTQPMLDEIAGGARLEGSLRRLAG